MGNNDFIEYGMLVTVKSANDSYLFLDGIDRDRYMSILIKMLERKQSGDALAIIAGLNNDTVKILFSKGCEEELRPLLRSIHTSYASYRRIKKCPVHFGRSVFELLEGKFCIANAVRSIRENTDYICTVFYRSEGASMQPGALMERIDILPESLTDGKLLHMAQRYKKVTSMEEFLQNAASEEKRAFAKDLKNKYNISYRQIGTILKCSHTTVYRMVNKSS